ncbi:MAG: 6-phosphofructokinase [Candidatus Margulisiibacteriota bacterium]
MIVNLESTYLEPLAQFESRPSDEILVPSVFKENFKSEIYTKVNQLQSTGPKRIGIVFSGGPAPGGHDVLVGILSNLRDGDELIGFIGGFGGVLLGRYFLIDPMDAHFLEGSAGFDYLGTDRTKISTTEHFNTIASLVDDLALDVFMVVGGDDSNTNATYLAKALGTRCQVIGIPKTIDGDLRFGSLLPVSFGFHTATHHYATMVNNLAIDALATEKYFHFIKLMGRSASYVTLEVAYQTFPHACLLSEEVVDSKWRLMDVVDYFSSIVKDRIAMGRPFGVFIFPEGLSEVVPELKAYLDGDDRQLNAFYQSIQCDAPMVFKPLDEDGHGNKNLSALPLERILMDCVVAYVKSLAGINLMAQAHFFGYEGRSCKPTHFDSLYSKLLGKTAYELALSNANGVMVGCEISDNDVRPCGFPLPAMMGYDSVKKRWIIKKSLVDVSQNDYLEYRQQKKSWVSTDPGFPRTNLYDYPKCVVFN